VRELQPYGTTVNASAPGAIAPGAERCILTGRLGAYEACVLQRRARLKDVANVVALLVPDRTRMFNGQTTCVDGGW
jgi:NAD(P)-dependent dehydrogenase (short-subunit alcohol dehydrogenase family)